jgi:hypothetical protein
MRSFVIGIVILTVAVGLALGLAYFTDGDACPPGKVFVLGSTRWVCVAK